MTVSTLQSSFSAGEISPELYGEVDLKKLSSAATTLRNMQVNYRGGAMSRGGLALVGVSLQTIHLINGTSTGVPRPIPFQFSITQGYILEFGDNYLRFIFEGGYVLENPVTITGATQANPCQIDVAGTPFANGDWVFISGVEGMTQLNGNTYIVAGAAGGHFTLKNLQTNAVDSTGFGAYTGGGTVSRLYTVATPYAAVDLPYLKVAQSADVMTLTCSNPTNSAEYPSYQLTRLSAIDWTLVADDFDPTINPPTFVNAAANAAAPSSGVNATFSYVVTAVDVAGNESIASGVGSCNGADIEVEGGSNTISWPIVAGAKLYNVYRTPASVDGAGGPIPPPAGSLFGFVGSSYGTSFSDTQSSIDLSQTPPIHSNPFAPGQILAVDITNPGSGLSAVTFALTTSMGVNFSGYPVVNSGSLGAFPINNNGEMYAPGDSIAFNGAGFATGAIDFGTTNPSASNTITLNGVVWTFVTALTASHQTLIGGSLAATLAQLVSDLLASSDPGLTVASYAEDSLHKNLIITYRTPGVGGDAYTLAASAATPSGSTLTGGAGGPSTDPAATLEIGPTTGTYPGVNAYFQQRRFFANSLNNPDTFWASQTGLYSNFDISIPPVATDAITASPWTEQVNGIQWLVPMPGGLIALTGSRAWQIVGEGSYALNSQPITPTTTQAQPQAFNGCSATVPPIVIDYDVLYVEAIGNTTVRDLSYNFFTSIYTGSDLTLLSSHLFLYRRIVQWAWARNPYKIMWASCDDGTMLSLTYLKEQEVYGWARHDSDGLIAGMASITEPPVDAVYVVAVRFPPYAPGGIYTVERMDNRTWQSVENAYAVDSGVSNPMASPDTALFASDMSGAVTFSAGASVFSSNSVGQIIRMSGGIAEVTGFTSGSVVTGTWALDPSPSALGAPFAPAGAWTIATPVATLNAPHLAGATLVGLADGVPISGLLVSVTGLVTLPFVASDAKVGLPFVAQLQTPYMNGQGVTQGARKMVNACTVRVAASAAFQIGTNQPDGAAQNPPNIGQTWPALSAVNVSQPGGGQAPAATYTSPGGQPVTQSWTGDLYKSGMSGATWQSKGQIAIQQTLPLALEVTMVAPDILDGDLPERAYSPQQQSQSQPRPPGRHMIA